jgi:phage shock protein A
MARKKALKGTAFALDKHRKIVREVPERMEKRMQNIAARHEILNAAEAYSARLERDRATAHLHSMAPGLQSAAALHHIGELNARIHRLAGKGLPK